MKATGIVKLFTSVMPPFLIWYQAKLHQQPRTMRKKTTKEWRKRNFKQIWKNDKKWKLNNRMMNNELERLAPQYFTKFYLIKAHLIWDIDKMLKIYRTYLGPQFPFLITISKGCIKILLKKSPAVNMLIWSN